MPRRHGRANQSRRDRGARSAEVIQAEIDRLARLREDQAERRRDVELERIGRARDKAEGVRVIDGGLATRDIPLSKIHTPVEYQRPLDMRWVRKIVAEFDSMMWTRPEVSIRPDGEVMVVDGQHRVEALRLMYKDDPNVLVTCDVVQTSTLQEESKRFLGRNAKVKLPTRQGNYRANLQAGDRITREIDQAIRSADYRPHLGTNPSSPPYGEVPVNVLYTLRLQYGPDDVVTPMLQALQAAWGTNERLSFTVLLGVGSFISMHGKEPAFTMERLVKVLSRISSDDLAFEFNRMAHATNKSKAMAARDAMILLYNKGLRTGPARIGPDKGIAA